MYQGYSSLQQSHSGVSFETSYTCLRKKMILLKPTHSKYIPNWYILQYYFDKFNLFIPNSHISFPY